MHDTDKQPTKVLLFAYAQWAKCLRRIIESQTSDVVLEVVSIDPGESLSRSVFVRTEDQLAVSGDADQDVHSGERANASNNQRTLLFEWREYDVVILQDIFKVDDRLLGEGYVWGSTSYYELGNFSTRIICLCTDPAYVLYQESETSSLRETAFDQLSSSLDEKGIIEFVDVYDQYFVSSLTDSIRGTRQPRSQKGKSSAANRFLKNVYANAFQHLLDGLITPTQLIFVDDDIVDLKNLCAEMFGTSLSEQLGETSERCVNVVCVETGFQIPSTVVSCEGAETFEDLVRKCSKHVRLAFENPDKLAMPCVLVTDILFRVAGFADQTGVDLIGEMHRISGDHLQADNRLGVIAYTGFHSQFITMAAHNQGADYLILKRQRDEPSQTGHGLSNPGPFRVALTIAYLCFQKQLLRDIRHRAKPCRARDPKKIGKALLLELRRMLPKTSISLHVLDEWRHTMTLLRSLELFGETAEYHQRCQKICEHYDA